MSTAVIACMVEVFVGWAPTHALHCSPRTMSSHPIAVSILSVSQLTCQKVFAHPTPHSSRRVAIYYQSSP
jgi:hypothetical protein